MLSKSLLSVNCLSCINEILAFMECVVKSQGGHSTEWRSNEMNQGNLCGLPWFCVCLCGLARLFACGRNDGRFECRQKLRQAGIGVELARKTAPDQLAKSVHIVFSGVR